jgi:hypothetical protein
MHHAVAAAFAACGREAVQVCSGVQPPEPRRSGEVLASAEPFSQAPSDVRVALRDGVSALVPKAWFYRRDDVGLVAEDPGRELSVRLVRLEAATIGEAIARVGSRFLGAEVALDDRTTKRDVDGWDEITEPNDTVSRAQCRDRSARRARRRGHSKRQNACGPSSRGRGHEDAASSSSAFASSSSSAVVTSADGLSLATHQSWCAARVEAT